MPTVDSLDIQISAQASKASASLDSLAKKLDRVSASLSGVNSRGLATMGAGVNKLANAMANFSKNTKSADFTRIAKDFQKLSNIDVSKISGASKAIAQIGNAMNGIKGLDFGNNANQISNMVKSLSGLNKIDAGSIKNATNAINKIAGAMNAIKGMNFGDSSTRIAELAKGISALGYKSAQNAVENIPKLANAMKQFMSTLSTAPKVSQNLIDMTNAMAKFARTGSSGGKAANALGNSISSMAKKFAYAPSVMNSFNKVTNKSVLSVTKIKDALKSLAGQFVSLYAVFGTLKKSIDISSDLTEVQNVIDVTFGKYKSAIEDFSKTSITDFGMSELTAKTMAGRFQAMGTAIGFSQKKMSDMSVELTKLSADMASFYNVSQEDVAKSLQSVFTGETEPLRKYGLDLAQVTLEEWAHKQGVDANMRSMSQAEKTMLRYQYVLANTGAAQGDFARTADTWANQIRVLKQNFEVLGSIVGGVLINAFKPFVKALNVIMLQITKFAETISNALGKIFGWTYEEGGGAVNPAEDLASGMGDVADATDDATKKQKEFNKQLHKFDELNNYTTSDKSGGSGGSGSGDLGELGDAASGGKWKLGKSIIKEFESEIDSLYKLGKYIGDALSKSMESINWDSVYKKAQGFGTGLANFLNGLISPRLFGNLGKTIANSLNTALNFLNSFGTTFDWWNFGNSIATGINSFFKNFDFKLLATTFNTWANGILATMITAVQGIDWKQIASKIAELINSIDAKGISWKLGKLANSLANAFYQLVSNKETWTALGTKIGDGINGLFESMNDVDEKTGLTGFQALGKNISESISGIANTITTALKGVDWETVGQSIGDFIASIDFANVAWDLTKLASSLFSAIVDAVSGFVEKAPLESAIIGLFAGLKLTGLGATVATLISTALASKNLSLGKIVIGIGLGAATLKLADKGKWSSSILSGITAFLATKVFTGNVKLSLKVAAVTVTATAGFTLGKKVGEWINDQMSTEDMSEYRYEFKFSDLFTYSPEEWKQGVADMIVDYEEALSEKKEEILQATADWLVDSGLADIPSKIVGFFSTAWEKIKSIWSKVKGFFSDVWRGIKSVFAGVVDWFKNIFSKAWNGIKGVWSKVKGFFSGIWNGIKGVFSGVGNWFKNIFSKAWNGVKNAWGATKNFFSGIWNNIKGVFGGVADWFRDKFSTAWKKVKDVFSTGGKVFNGIKDGILKGLKTVINELIKGINKVIKIPFDGISTALEKIKNISIAGNKPFSDLIPEIIVPQIPMLAVGGFPEDGWFRANHGEIMGQFDNGQSVVANNKQITEGISMAVQKGNQENNMLMRQEISILQRQNELLLDILEKETGIKSSELFDAVRNEDLSFYRRNGHGAFSY